MVIKIGGIEIDKASKIEEVTQLRAGLDELGIDGAIDGFQWMADLSIEERFQFAQIVGEYLTDSAISIFTFGFF